MNEELIPHIDFVQQLWELREFIECCGFSPKHPNCLFFAFYIPYGIMGMSGGPTWEQFKVYFKEFKKELDYDRIWSVGSLGPPYIHRKGVRVNAELNVGYQWSMHKIVFGKITGYGYWRFLFLY